MGGGGGGGGVGGGAFLSPDHRENMPDCFHPRVSLLLQLQLDHWDLVGELADSAALVELLRDWDSGVVVKAVKVMEVKVQWEQGVVLALALAQVVLRQHQLLMAQG